MINFFTVVGFLNDLWKFDGTNWTWISGSKVINQPGIYGEKRVADPNNIIGSRHRAVSWIDSKKNLYLFGGIDIFASDYFNDLWGIIIHKCFGKSPIDPQVCSGRGKCIDENVCECTNSVGLQCEIPLCFDIPANVSNVCSGRGDCIDLNVCKCNPGWTGINCSEMVYSCHGKNTNNPSVCSGRGICKSQDNCVCNENWFGEQCDIPQCFGILGNDSSVCSGNGNCTDYNVCVCENGWKNNECNIPTCFGKIANETSVCSGRGKCIGINQCKCDPRYLGDECTKERLIIVYATANIPSWSWLYILIFFVCMVKQLWINYDLRLYAAI